MASKVQGSDPLRHAKREPGTGRFAPAAPPAPDGDGAGAEREPRASRRKPTPAGNSKPPARPAEDHTEPSAGNTPSWLRRIATSTVGDLVTRRGR